MNIGVARKQNIDGNQNDAQFSHVLCFKRFILHKFYRCVWYVYTLRVFSVRCSISTTANKREYIKKMNASLPVVRKCHRDLSFVNATDALPSSVRMCNSAYLYSARTQQTPSQNRYTKPAARLSVHTHSQWRVAIWLYIERKKVDAALYTNRVYG